MSMGKDPHIVTASHRIYQSLLGAYPRRFREAFRDEMAVLFRDCAREIYRSKGRWGVVRLWARALFDLTHNVPREHIVSQVRKDDDRAYETLSCSACYSVIQRDWTICKICGEALVQNTTHVSRPMNRIDELERLRRHFGGMVG